MIKYEYSGGFICVWTDENNKFCAYNPKVEDVLALIDKAQADV